MGDWSVIVPRPICTAMVSAPGLDAASSRAWRSEPGPASLVLVTSKLVAEAGGPNATSGTVSTASPARAVTTRREHDPSLMIRFLFSSDGSALPEQWKARLPQHRLIAAR